MISRILDLLLLSLALVNHAASLDLDLHVDTSSSCHTVDRRYLGVNLDWPPQKPHENCGQVDESYLSFNLDWWPADEGCAPYGWGAHSNVLEVDLSSPVLRSLTKALGPSILRIGGTLEKVVEYDIPEEGVHCTHHDDNDDDDLDKKKKKIKSPCMNMSRWDALHDFARATNSQIMFGISYPQLEDGSWNATPARALLRYSRRKNYSQHTTLRAIELGEELVRFHPGTEAFDQYAAAYKKCADMLRDIWKNEPAAKPLLVGPSPGMMWPQLATWFPAVLEATSGALDVAVYHSYNQIEDGKLYLNYTIPSGNLSTQKGGSPGDTGWQALAMQKWVRQHNQRHDQHQIPLWLGEFGPHNGGGGPGNISSTFASSFGYLDTLGSLARLNHSMLARQTLLGGKYELLRCSTSHPHCTLEPHPDYWVALLWQRLMGTTVLQAPTVTVRSSSSSPSDWEEPLRFHAYCSVAPNDHTDAAAAGSVTVAFSNTHNHSKTFRLFPDPDLLGPTRMEYVLQGHPHGFQAGAVQLNGKLLAASKRSGKLPAIRGLKKDNGIPFTIPPISLGFLVFESAKATVCGGDAAATGLGFTTTNAVQVS